MPNKNYQRPARTKPAPAGDVTPFVANAVKQAAMVAKAMKAPKPVGHRRGVNFLK